MAEYADTYARSRYDQGIDAKVVVMGTTGMFLSYPFVPPIASFSTSAP